MQTSSEEYTMLVAQHCCLEIIDGYNSFMNMYKLKWCCLLSIIWWWTISWRTLFVSKLLVMCDKLCSWKAHCGPMCVKRLIADIKEIRLEELPPNICDSGCWCQSYDWRYIFRTTETGVKTNLTKGLSNLVSVSAKLFTFNFIRRTHVTDESQITIPSPSVVNNPQWQT